MRADAALADLARRTGILDAYTDMQGLVHPAGPETQRALLRANGLAAGSEAEVRETRAILAQEACQSYVPPDVIVPSGGPVRIDVSAKVRWTLLSEDAATLLAEGRSDQTLEIPAVAPGVYPLRLEGRRGVQTACLIVAPPRAPSLQELAGTDKSWGIVAALYGVTSEAGQSLGDFEDLATLAAAAGTKGAGFFGINPVHALGWAAEETISPYSPTHRGFLNIDHITVHPSGLSACPDGLVDYAAHRHRQRSALKSEFDRFSTQALPQDRTDFEGFCTEGHARLEDFARFEHLSARHGPDWRRWPADVRLDASDPKVARALTFHKWMQWRADTQLGAAQSQAKSAAMSLGLYLDLAVGARLGGAESWGAQAATAQGVALGAPPDHLSPAGQNWQLAALSPRKLQQGRYAALRFVLARTMRHCGLLRIDHALGLSRSFWIPEDGSPGGYIRHSFRSLLAIIALEAHRAGTVIVGEDLGLVPDGFRTEMAGHGLYGYSVLQYEKDESGRFLPTRTQRTQSLACFGTHDTPTLRGFWQGHDIDWWQKLGWIGRAEAARARKARESEKRQLAGIKAPKPLPPSLEVSLRDSVHKTLAESPAALVAVQLDDILNLTEAQNLPGTTHEHPNWRRRYPATVEDIANSPDLRKTARIMADAGRTKPMRKDDSQ